MKKITLKELLEAGAHFGHQVNRWNPKAREFIYTERDKIHIIDLAKTRKNLEEAANFVKTSASQGGKIIFVGTKKQARKIIEEEAKRVGAMYLTKRWLGGLMTNWEQIKKNLERIRNLESLLRLDSAMQDRVSNSALQNGTTEGQAVNKTEEKKIRYTKYELGLFQKELDKLMGLYGGIYDLAKIPEMLFIVDTKNEQSAVKEALRKEVRTIAISDTNSDPTQIDYPIPANDDAVGSIKLITNYIAEAYKEGVEEYKKKEMKLKDKKPENSEHSVSQKNQ